MPFMQREIWESCQHLPRIVIFHLNSPHFTPFKADLLLYHHLNCWTAPLLPSLWRKQLDSSWTFLEIQYVDSCKHGEHCAPASRPEESWGQELGEPYLSFQGVYRPQGLRKNEIVFKSIWPQRFRDRLVVPSPVTESSLQESKRALIPLPLISMELA